MREQLGKFKCLIVHARQAETIEIASGVLSLGKFFFFSNRTLIIFLETEIEMSTGK